MTDPVASAPDTIAARATPAGRGFQAMVRLSGPGALAVVRSLGAGPSLDSAPGGTVLDATLTLTGSLRVPARILVFRSPRSYTGEDVAEVHVPGSPLLIAALLEAVYARGARPAGPGEFTRRAYLSGRLDLTRAEGIQALIAARDDAERRGALELTGGIIADRVEALRDALLTLMADLEASLDFLDHEVDPDTFPHLETRLGGIEDQLRSLIQSTRGDARPSGAPRGILWGHPNAGKSTLFNWILGRVRAATDSTPGTTRDVLGGRVQTPRGEVLLYDAPGVGSRGRGEADRAATRTAEGQRGRMDLRMVTADGSEPRMPPDPGAGDCLLILSKIDLKRRLDPEAWIRAHHPVSVVEVSAREDQGLDRVLEALGDWRAGASPGQDGVVSAGRLHALFHRALEDLDRLREAHRVGFGAECLSLHLRSLVSALEEVTGRVFTEEVLDSVFSRFCIGK